MIAPGTRLILVSAFVALPLLTAAWIGATLALFAVAAATAILVLFTMSRRGPRNEEAGRSNRGVPAAARWTKDRESRLSIKLENIPAGLCRRRRFPTGDPPPPAGVLVRLHPRHQRGETVPTHTGVASNPPLQAGTLVHLVRYAPSETLIRVYHQSPARTKPPPRSFIRSLGGLRPAAASGKGREFEKLHDYAPRRQFSTRSTGRPQPAAADTPSASNSRSSAPRKSTW